MLFQYRIARCDTEPGFTLAHGNTLFVLQCAEVENFLLCLAGSPFSIEILHNDDRVINEVRDRQNNGKNEI